MVHYVDPLTIINSRLIHGLEAPILIMKVQCITACDHWLKFQDHE